MPDAQQLTVKDAIPEDQLNEEAKKEIEKIKEIEKMVNRKDLTFETNKHVWNFQQLWSLRSFAESIFDDENTLNYANKDQSSLSVLMMHFKKKQSGNTQRKNAFFGGRKKVFNDFKNRIFSLALIECTERL